MSACRTFERSYAEDAALVTLYELSLGHERASFLQPKLARVPLVRRADAAAGVTGLSIDGIPYLSDTGKKPLYVAPGQHASGVTIQRRTDALLAGQSQRIEMDEPAPGPAMPPVPGRR